MTRTDGCIKCGACQAVCPVLRQEGPLSFPGPRRLAVEAPRFSREAASLSSSLQMCTSCALCEAACPSRLPLTEAVFRMRARYGAKSEGGQRMLANVRRYGRTIAPTSKVRAPTEGSVLFFPGCVGDARTSSAVQGSVDLLLASGERVFVPEQWLCCGSPLEKIGERDEVRRLRELNAPMLEKAEGIVTACPGCAVQLRRAGGVEALHVLEHLYESVTPSRLRWRSRPLTVALHSPCHLVRSVGPHTMDYAHELLSSVPGLRVVDMDDEGCCGGGGGVASARPDLAARMARRRTDSAARAGAQVLLAPCPFCVVNLQRAGGVEVQELTAFLADLSEHRR
jgi:Fe-S oxidoreductase